MRRCDTSAATFEDHDMFQRIGELLVRYGELSNEELSTILAEQRRDYRPFGRIAADMFDISESAIWNAWSEQYAEYCPRIQLDDQLQEPAVLNELTSDEAWEFYLLPLRCQDGDLILVTSEDHLPKALQFLDRRLSKAVLVWLAGNPDQLYAALRKAYPVDKYERAVG